ncbi:hypothetical protein PPL_01290 [Heterostelium album PN500]|uniref:ER membrane protein complex subunit 1 n=1 Tax=Heterostelium pallidum (strain ATCC 26659 / Pp 5 / PN500) TaxID=670386 RepID=D3AYM7_HETP5|nr:hypothetical protein PPL_01290 [Heterostelium album PN500]EFA86054.1 hypothetical protein PPL_01290 [Heterostelium album PN500]|eukprot:XP_020438160.1 hypothetical protein PPL_01290 [Heterostelium album PN500]
MEIINKDNLFVNLSHLLLKKIISNLDEIAERIIFTLVCKRWFRERNSYLFFNNLFDKSFDDDYMLTRLQSYQSILKLEYKEELFLVEEATQNSYQITPNEILETDNFFEFKYLTVKLNQYDISKLKDRLELSNITYLRLPPTTPRLSAGSLPENLENLMLSDYGYLLEFGDLPVSLKVLSLYNYNRTLVNGSLPPRLKRLRLIQCYNNCDLQLNTISQDVFTSTLTSIENSPYQWIKYFKYLPLLESFSSDGDIPSGFLEPGDFPDTLTRLKLQSYKSYIRPGVIPSSIKHLTLNSYCWNPLQDSIPKDAHYEHLCVFDSPAIEPNQLPLNIKSLEMLSPNYIIEGVIPSTTKSLYLFTNMVGITRNTQRLDSRSIPNSVENLYLGDGYTEFDSKLLPDSIRTLKLRAKDIFRNGIDSFKPSITCLQVGSYTKLNRIDNNNFIAHTPGEEIGVKDWRIKNIGLVERSIIYDKDVKPTILVQSSVPSLDNYHNNYLLSLLNLNDGSIIWRQLLPRQEHSFESIISISNSQIVTLSNANKLRLWNRLSGSVVWSTSLTNTDASNEMCSRVVQVSENELMVICESMIHTVSVKSGMLTKSSPITDSQSVTVIDNHNRFNYDKNTFNGLPLPGNTGGVSNSNNQLTGSFLKVSSSSESNKKLVVIANSNTLYFGSEKQSLESFKVEGAYFIELLAAYDDAGQFAIRVNEKFIHIYQFADDGKSLALVKKLEHVGGVAAASGSKSADYIVKEESGSDAAFIISGRFATKLTEKSNGRPVYLITSGGGYSVVVTKDWTLTVYLRDQLLWQREESLAAILQTEITDSLPSNIGKLSQLEYEFTESSSDNFMSHLTRRLWAQLNSVVGKSLGVAVDDQAAAGVHGVEHAWSEEFNKLVIVSTAAGKIHCLSSSDRGFISWSIFYPEYNGESLRLYISGRQPDIKAIVVYSTGRDGAVSNIVSTVNINKGVEVASKIINQRILHSSIIPLASDKSGNDSSVEHLFMAALDYPAGHPPSVMIHPWTGSARANWESFKSIHFYIADRDRSVVRGYSIESMAGQGQLKSHLDWNLNFGSQQKIVAIGASNPHEVIGTPAIILGNRDLLPKYINRNLISIATVDAKTSMLTMHLVDSITGEIIKTFLHQNVGGKISIVHIENSVIYSYFDITIQKQFITSIDLFEDGVNWNKQVFSSYDSNRNIIIKQKSFVFPSHIQTLSESVSSKGITSKFILVGTISGQVLPIEKKWIDARRPYPSEATPFDQEEGLIPYHPNLNFPPYLYITYNTTIPLLNSMTTAGTGKESTSIIVSTGIDFFVALIAPSSGYDVLSHNFNHFALISTSMLLAALTYITRMLRKNKILNRKWK